MCGRIVLKAPARQVAQEFELPVEPVLAPRYNIAPGQTIAVVWNDSEQGRACGMMRWGLIPPWARDMHEGRLLFNARSETARGKPAFYAAFASRRCLIPADGFYEWRLLPAPKQPFYFSATDERLLALAGLWSRWKGAGGDAHESCTILTTKASGLVRPIHDRMPVILAADQRDRWLCTPAARAGDLEDLLVPAAEGSLRVWPVAPLVNRAGAEGPACCEPLKQKPPVQPDLF